MKNKFEMSRQERIDFNNEAIDLLQKYIRIKSVNPPGDMDECIKFFTTIFDNEGIDYKIYTSNTGKKTLLAWIDGDGSAGKPFLLLNHMDVVPVETENWTFDAFSGEIRDGYITGRGTLDMKGMGIAELMSLLTLKRKKISLKRTLMFMAVPDEEMGGMEGAKYVVDNYFDEIDPEIVLDEGGFGTQSLTKDAPVFFVACGQKKGVWLRVRANGKSGHGSQPNSENPNDILIKALNKIIESPYPVDFDKDIWYSLKKLAKERSLKEYIICSLYRVPFVGRMIGRYLSKYPLFNAMIRNTLTITMIDGGIKVNVIPKVAEATIDCRVLPHVDVIKVLERMHKVINDKRVEIEIIKELREASTTDMKSKFLTKLEEVIRLEYKNAKVLPYITPVGTDAKYFREKGVKAYGIFPIVITQEDLDTFHGNDERILIKTYEVGCKLILELINEYCS